MYSTRHNIKFHLAPSFILCVAFFLPFSFANGIVYIWITLFAFTLIKNDFKDFKLFSRQNIPQLFILLLYILGVVSLLYAENTVAAVKQLTGQRLLMFLLPLAAITGLRNYSFTDILKIYVLGCFLFLLYLFSLLSWQFIAGMPVEFLTIPYYISTWVTDEILHRSYISLNLTLAIIATVYLLKNRQIERKNYPLYAVFLAIASFTILYLNSRAAFLAITVLLLFYFVYFVRKSPKLLFWFALAFSLCFALFFMVPNRLADYIMPTEQTAVKQEEPRIVIWKNAWEIIQHQPFYGYGTASGRDVLLLQYEKNDFQQGIVEKFNAHNQYIEYLIEYGWIGLMLFLIALCSIPIVCDKKKRLFYIPFVLVFAINLFFESMLMRNAGVVTFAFFVMLLGIKSEPDKSVIPQKIGNVCLKTGIIISILLLFFIGYSYYNLKQQDVYFHINPKVENNGVVQLDRHAKSATWNGNAYANSTFLYGNITENQQLTISTEAYVSEDFNGTWSMIDVETPQNLHDVHSYYDMNRKGTWQTLTLNIENLNEEVKAMFYICQDSTTTLDHLQGKVLFRNTSYSLTSK